MKKQIITNIVVGEEEKTNDCKYDCEKRSRGDEGVTKESDYRLKVIA